jgi:hypothetical protein
MVKVVFSTTVLLSRELDDPVSINPRKVLYFLDPLSLGIVTKISELGVVLPLSFSVLRQLDSYSSESSAASAALALRC